MKRSLRATGPLEFRGSKTDGGPRWESYDQRFNNTTHDRIVRLALTKLATAAIDLSGFATWREWQWSMRETGLRLLAWGLAQLWEGMSETERSRVRDRLSRTHKAIGWPANPATDPPAYDGPDEIPLPDQYRIVANYISCHRDYPDDVQKADNNRVKQGQEKFLRRATLVQFVETAERAEQALQAMAKRDFDSAVEWDDLYTKAFWPLACLRRAHEIQPREAWPVPALEQRKLLADAADILLTAVGGTPEAKAGLKPADVDEAFRRYNAALGKLREASAMSAGLPSYKEDAYWRDPFTLEHLIYVLRVYEELKAKDAAPGRENAVQYGSGLEKPSDPAPAVVQAEATTAAAPGSNASLALMRVFTNGIADDRIEKATRLLGDNKLTVNEKLTKIDALIPFPATSSAEQLGDMLGVTKQAVLKTDWWIQNRKGEKDSEVGRRREGHRKRVKYYEAPGQDDDE